MTRKTLKTRSYFNFELK